MTYPHPESGQLLYWRYERSGVLEIAVQRFVNDLPLHSDLYAYLKDYFQHWADFDGWKVPSDQEKDLRRLRSTIHNATTVEELQSWLDLALDLGIDPL